jgi:hypothetical protein
MDESITDILLPPLIYLIKSDDPKMRDSDNSVSRANVSIWSDPCEVAEREKDTAVQDQALLF